MAPSKKRVRIKSNFAQKVFEPFLSPFRKTNNTALGGGEGVLASPEQDFKTVPILKKSETMAEPGLREVYRAQESLSTVDLVFPHPPHVPAKDIDRLEVPARPDAPEPHDNSVPNWDLSTISSRGTSAMESFSHCADRSGSSTHHRRSASESTNLLSLQAVEVQNAAEAMISGTGQVIELGEPLQEVDVGQVEVLPPVDVKEPSQAIQVHEPLQALAEPKYVFAHFMVGNTYPYTVDDWYADIQLAASQEVDGFVLNVGREDWQRARAADCFAAASRLPDSVKFKFFYSFDMTSIPGGSAGDVQLLVSYFGPFANHPRMFKHPRTGGTVISTFSGENSTWGQGRMEDGWAYVKRELSKFTQIHFIATFFVNPARYPSITAMDGAFNWNGGWPIHLTPDSPRSDIVRPRLDSDQPHLQNLGNGRTFMAAVSPWFFTHYGPDTWNKNWIYRGDDWLFVRRWEQLISMRDQIDLVQVISWNDYGESHYIGPIKGAQPNSQAWVDGYVHEPWLHLNRYFATAYRNGSYPIITHDRIFMWARPQPKTADSPDHVPRPTNWQLTDDTIWVVAFTTGPAIVEIFTTELESKRYEVGAGMSKLSAPISENGGMGATITRGGNVVARCYPMGYRFETRPAVYNFNAFVAMS